MHSRVLRLGILGAAIMCAGAPAATRAAEPPPIQLSLANAKLSDVIRLLAANADQQIIFLDPEGQLAEKNLPFIQISNMTLEKALEKVCRAASAYFQKDKDGVIYISPRPFEDAAPSVRSTALAAPTTAVAPLPEPPVPQEPMTLQKITLQYLDVNHALYMLNSMRVGNPNARSIDELDIQPGLVDPTSQNWFLPGYQPAGNGPVFTPGARPLQQGLTGGNQFGGGFGGGGGQFGGGLGGGGFGGGGFGGGGQFGGGFGGGLGGGGLGGGLGGGGLGGGGGGANLVPPGIQGILGYPLDNSLLVRGTADDIQDLKNMIRLLDIPPRQIQIQIEQVAVNTTFQKTFGFDFSIFNNDLTVQSTLGGSTGGSISVGILGNGWRANFAASISNGTARVIDRQIITTMNNVPAFITSVNVSWAFLPQLQQVQGAGLVTAFVPLQIPIPTSLIAIPRVNGDGTITMFIPFTLSRVIGESVGPNGERLPNFVQTNLGALRRVASGQTIVVGGISSDSSSNSSVGIPLLKDLPLVGPLFRSRVARKDNNESLFFFTPTLLPEAVGLGGEAQGLPPQ